MITAAASRSASGAPSRQDTAQSWPGAGATRAHSGIGISRVCAMLGRARTPPASDASEVFQSGWWLTSRASPTPPW